MWSGKTITMVYSPRATPKATVSMPVTWEEIKVGIHPEDFHILNAKERLRKMGDLFKPLLLQEHIQNLDIMLEHAK
jgi:bifunctional non-homologous end joining protein LigD